jgi:broad specificity phosphatase PhoE
MKIFLVRHPETRGNKQNKFVGWKNSPYTLEGKSQFKKILKYFKYNSLKIYSSDLKRCLTLAKSISNNNQSKLIITPLLREKGLNETKEIFEKRVQKFMKEYNLSDSILILHSGVMIVIAKLIFKNINTEKKMNFPRDNIFLIETNKKQKRLYKISLKDGI